MSCFPSSRGATRLNEAVEITAEMLPVRTMMTRSVAPAPSSRCTKSVYVESTVPFVIADKI